MYSSRYHIDIGLHVFPTRKYPLVRQAIGDGSQWHESCAKGDGSSGTKDVPSRPVPFSFVEPEAATWDDLALVHTQEYLTKVRDGRLSREELAQLELPWSDEMVAGFRLMVGGTMTAARLATNPRAIPHLNPEANPEVNPEAANPQANPEANPKSRMPNPVVCHLGGGLHHAFANHGEGFCLFNDVAVAVRALQTHGIQRVAIVDLDVHHGNGTSFIFESDPSVFTFSMHQQHNYPVFKPRSSLDIGLPDGTHDETYLRALESALPKVLASGPQCVFYLAGADPYEDDLLGGLRLTKAGLRRRDRMVIDAVSAAGLPLVITLAGGYARNVEDTVAIHAATIEEAAAVAATLE